MKFLKLFFSIVFIIFSSLFLAASDDPCRKSTEGTDFWFGFMESRNYSNNHYLEITVTARETSNFQIFIGNNETPFNGNYTVQANDRLRIEIPWEMVEATGSEEVQDKGIKLVSENPVNVYALNYDRSSADVAVIFPTESLGKEYFAVCYDPRINEKNDGSYGNGRNSQFLIVASEDSTNVLIIPSKITDKLVNAGDSIIVTLNKGETYQVQSMNFEGLAGQGDLTSSYILSDKPVAFFSGSLATTIPAESGTSAWDHLYEQIPPVHSWGREYFAVPLKSREQDRYRVMAAQDSTILHIDGFQPILLNRGEFKEFVLYYNDPKRIYAEKPILVAQYSQSKSVDSDFTGGHGDPFMIILSSSTQSKNDVTFVAYDSDQIQKYFVNIITLTSEVQNIRLNGNPIQNDFQPFPNSNYSYAQKQIQSATYRINNINKDRGFLAYVYGFGNVESYGYGVGFNLDLVLDLGESINFNGDTLLLCHGESRTLDAGPYFDTYNWNTGDSTQTLEILNGGKYYVETTTIDGCVLEDSIFVFVSHPIVDIGDDDDGCAPYQITLDATDEFEKYVWQNQNNDTLAVDQIFVTDQTGEYRITVTNELNCTAHDTMNLVVFPVPKINIDGETLICGDTISQLNVSITDAPEDIWNYEGSFTWSSNKPSQLNFSEETHTSTEMEVSEWGEYEIYYHLKTFNDCIVEDTFLVRFHQIPTSNFEYVENPGDECEGYYREVLYSGNATQNADYYWDYGGSKVIDSMDWNNFTVSLGAFNSNPFLQLFVEEDGCWSDTTIKSLGANPDFILETGKARGCDSMTVLFKGTLGVADSLLFEWDLGDNSPIIHSHEVEHFYPNTGFYDVSLLITNLLSGCQIGFQIDSMIKVFPTPTADITADPSFCYTDSADIFYTFNIDSSICSWEFVDAHQTGAGNDSITILIEEPFGTAILTVDEYGCVSDPVEMTLKRKPHFDFYTEFEEGCQPYSLEILADPFDENLEFTWITDSLPYPTGSSNIYLLPDSGRFDITLITNSNETGCFDTLAKSNWIWVHPKPISLFDVDFPVALIEHADITFTNFSEYATNYYWDFGDKENSIESNPIHTFNDLGEYYSQLFVESDFGCKDTSELLITILPFSVFTPNAFRPDSDIPENRTFMPVGLGADLSRFSLIIYDRWGQMVFETSTPEMTWDGTAPNGKPAPMGNYIWVSNFFDVQGFEHNQKGQVLLVR
jgi:gliding motility-associated-like protein